MRINWAVTALAALVLGCSDGGPLPTEAAPNPPTPVAPVTPPVSVPKMAFIITATEYSGVNGDIGWPGFGVKTLDSAQYTLGLDFLVPGFPTRQAALAVGQTASISAFIGSSDFMGYDRSKSKSIFKFQSHWKALDAEKHPGVVYSDTSEIVFIVDDWKPGQSSHSAPTRLVTARTVEKDPLITLEVPNDTGVVRSVNPTQMKHIGCRSDDSLKIVNAGLFILWTDNSSLGEHGFGGVVADMRVTCEMFATLDEAQKVLAGRVLYGAIAWFQQSLIGPRMARGASGTRYVP